MAMKKNETYRFDIIPAIHKIYAHNKKSKNRRAKKLCLYFDMSHSCIHSYVYMKMQDEWC